MSSSEREAETLHQICLSPSSSHFRSLLFSLSPMALVHRSSWWCQTPWTNPFITESHRWRQTLSLARGEGYDLDCPLPIILHFCFWVLLTRKRVLYCFQDKIVISKYSLFSFCELRIRIYIWLSSALLF